MGLPCLVCDRYSAYKKLARLAAGQLVLAFCWAPVRRDFIKAAAARGDLDDWKDQWLARIRRLYRLNAQRLRCHDPGRPPDRRHLRMHFRLSRVLGEVFMEVERELATVDDASPQGKVLQSLLRHRRGLSRVCHYHTVDAEIIGQFRGAFRPFSSVGVRQWLA